MQLRYYQEEAKDAVFEQWNNGISKTLLVQATGTGKTIVFSKIIEDLVRDGERVLILAHRGELLEQATDKLAQATNLKTAVEKAEETSVGSWYRVVVGSVQTLTQDKRLEQFKPDHFDTIVVDEAHRSVSPSYQKVLEYFSKAKVLGVTATPDRSDMINLGTYYETLAYEYTLPQAIKDGYLVPIKALTLPLKIDLSNVSISGDFNLSDIDTALDPFLYQIAKEMAEYCKDRKTIVFLPLIATSQKFLEILNEYECFNAVEVNGNSVDREEKLQDFEDNKYNVLLNSMLLTEGYDSPAVDCIVVLRPTKVRSLYTQMVGRGTRLHPGKKELLLLDFLWHTDRHDLCHPAHLISSSDEVASKMTEMIEKETDQGEYADIMDFEEVAANTVQEEREEALAEELKKKRNMRKRLVDPIQYEMSVMDEDLTSYIPKFAHEIAPPTEEQMQFLENAGISPNEINSSGKASLLIDRVKTRQQQGLSTAKQIRLLERYGFKQVGKWGFEDAKKMVARISMSGWRTPRGVNPETYKPTLPKIQKEKEQEQVIKKYGW